MRPLDGITVLALEHAIAGPYCTRQLADLGARVIKLERPDGGDFARGYDTRVAGLASHFVWVNRSKESLAFDLKHPDAPEVLARLLARTDVLVQNLGPGAASRLGLGHDTLRWRHPRLVVCDISGYGDGGPYGDRRAYDLLVQAEAGLLSVTGSAEAPAKAGISIADIAAGMQACSGILAALIQRGRTGRGSRVDVSLFEAMVEWMGYPLYYAHDGAPPPPRTGAAHATIHPYGPYPTGDGGTLLLAVQNEREWTAFCAHVLDRPDLASDPRHAGNPARVAARGEIDALVTAAFAGLTTAQAADRLDRAGIAWARVNDMQAVWNHAQLQARERWRTVATPAGPVPALRPPGVPHDVPVRMDPVPALGEHGDAILAELGYDAATRARWRALGVTGGSQ